MSSQLELFESCFCEKENQSLPESSSTISSSTLNLHVEEERKKSTRNHYLQQLETKKRLKAIKNIKLRRATVDEIIYIFEKVLEGWKNIKIYNLILQKNPQSKIIKEDVDHIATGNCKVYEFENKFEIYQDLRKKVYDYRRISSS